ncbi:(R)-mandelonitrile lyase [Jongsikchunia kroppenstedtii]|uniref:(R)-mandelonitrile lyase n=1 Tax=Jongsikchunia kroppenstedtii TaxID=1121721 RepID=UPI00036EB010|nr:cupin domain-containing protein [Jongsikchunia kroppenstedtii]
MELIPVSATAKGPVERFTGDVYVTPISPALEPMYLAAGTVHFMPGARTNWHVHPKGQILHVLAGVALVGTRDGAVIAAHGGETVSCDPNVEHWHGATASNLAVHIAIVEASADHDGTDWLEPVTEEEYAAAQVAALAQ